MVQTVQDWETMDTSTNSGAEAMFESGVQAIPRLVYRVRDQRARIVANWTLRVATLPAFRATPNLGLRDVERRIPEVLEGALISIATSDSTLDPAPLERATVLAAAHGESRLQDAFGAGDVIAEFNALRREVWSALWRIVETEAESIALVRELDVRIATTFDALTVAAADAWARAAMGSSAS